MKSGEWEVEMRWIDGCRYVWGEGDWRVWKMGWDGLEKRTVNMS